ncbi:MAG: DNA-3-methyladenine glycosylase family protein [Coprococcus sp.]
MIKKTFGYFNLAQICDSGQCFRMEQVNENTWSVIASGRYLEIMQQEDICTFYCSEKEYEGFWKGYFDLDTDYGMYIDRINPKDLYLMQAAELGAGIRILRQDLWEMIVSFLISQQNNIIRIRRCIRNICEQYGERKVMENGQVYYTFPAPEALAELDEDALKACNLGYRSKYVVRTAKAVVSGEVNLNAVREMPYKKAREELLKLFGVGEKVADCICLFALHHLEAFPVDTHIRQALDSHYKKGFPNRRYKGVQGVMQQYIFYYEFKGRSLR